MYKFTRMMQEMLQETCMKISSIPEQERTESQEYDLSYAKCMLNVHKADGHDFLQYGIYIRLLQICRRNLGQGCLARLCA